MQPNINHLTQLLDNAKNTAPSHQAFVGLGTSISYKKLYQHSVRLANYLSNHTDNGTVAIMMPNLLSFPVSLFGIWYSDRTITLINPLYTNDEVLKQCLDAQVKTIIIAKIFYKTLKPILKNTDIWQVITVEIGDLQPLIKRYALNLITCIKRNVFFIKKNKNIHHTTLHEILNNTSAVPNQKTFQNTVALLQYTGGTSGVLKAATLEHKNILANIHQLEHWLPKSINQNSLILTALPLYHIFALTINCLLFVYIKGNNILVLNPREIKQLITPLKKYHIGVITGVNTLFGALVKHKDFKNLNWSTLKIAISGGMSLDKNISDQWQSITGKPIIQGYGLTECSPVVSAEGYQTNKFSGSVGKPLIETKIKILDKSHQALKTNEVGEISIKGPQVMASYWHKQALNQQVFTQDGYFLSGDMGYVDKQGRIFIVDRLKDMLIVSGFNVYPCEIEQVLNQHPDVVESACIGIEHEISGQIVKAFVVKQTSSRLEKQVLIDYCKKHLAHYKIPRKIQWVDSLPKSNIGKILKRKLTD
ncbi:AMP-binding protein [Abyssogena phaseoliformis symbiont]|uniref:AMP-binding protein n=1 Tax=Abyssogena phaseoliformis symbiont TaxID=596095 RepID=UPI0019154FA3|nr:AMP-binding protein [Abyssogena phaseoliformis symbiont]MBW5289249.1 Long-chain-fatty-acid--CoA ligase [Candidatus Ruthia sp. Apha_13_S6]